MTSTARTTTTAQLGEVVSVLPTLPSGRRMILSSARSDESDGSDESADDDNERTNSLCIAISMLEAARGHAGVHLGYWGRIFVVELLYRDGSHVAMPG